MRRKLQYIICMIKNVYFLYNYSINCWGRIDPEDHLKVKPSASDG